MKGLVFTGGSIKGGYEAGAALALSKMGFIPDVVCGISVGSLNSTLLVHYMFKNHSHDMSTMVAATSDMVKFWQDNVKSPEAIIRKRSFGEMIWKAIRGKFDGMLDTTPLRNLLFSFINPVQLKYGPVLSVGAVNMYTGMIEYARPGQDNFLDFVMASTAIPIVMPPVWIKGYPYFDGGLRDIAPLRQAINLGATEIVVVACQPENYAPYRFNIGNPIKTLLRTTDILTTEVLENDLAMCDHINRHLKEYPGKKMVDVQIIRPEQPIAIDIEDFDSDDITDSIRKGYFDAFLQYNAGGPAIKSLTKALEDLEQIASQQDSQAKK